MSTSDIKWPQKNSELIDETMDSRIWNDFTYRPDDIVISTYSKSGTTWVQQIVAQLIFNGLDVSVRDLSPWLEFKHAPKDQVLSGLDQQSNRRFIKTHLPVESLKFDTQAKYIYVVRDGRDIAFSYYHFYSLLPHHETNPLNPDIRQYFIDWLDKDGYPFYSFFSHVKAWWDIRTLPNVLLVHFSNLKADMPSEIRRIASFLNIEINEDSWPNIVEHCTFDYMKKNAESVGPVGATLMKGGHEKFFRSGKSGIWRDILTEADSEKYESMINSRLSADCALWLRTGELVE